MKDNQKITRLILGSCIFALGIPGVLIGAWIGFKTGLYGLFTMIGTFAGMFAGTALAIELINRYEERHPSTRREPEDDEEETDHQEQEEAVIAWLRENTSVPVIRITAEPGHAGLRDSKFGGIPYWPSGMAYPKKGETPLVLLAQIRCDELPENDRLPKQGLLQFFIASEDSYGVNWNDASDHSGYRVVYHEQIDPSVTEDDVRALGISTAGESEEMSILPLTSEFVLHFQGDREPASSCSDRFDELVKQALRETCGEEMEGVRPYKYFGKESYQRICEYANAFDHKMLGYPAFTQWDPRPQDSPYDTLLFQMDSRDGILWGDSGVGNFFISSQKLAERDFSDVLYSWDCY